MNVAMNIVLFEDKFAHDLSPVSLARPTFAITCGALDLAELAGGMGGSLSAVVRPYLREVAADYLPEAAAFDITKPTLLLNARLVPDADAINSLVQRCELGSFKVVIDSQLAAALVPARLSGSFAGADQSGLDAFLQGPALEEIPSADEPLRMFSNPFEIIIEQERVMLSNLRYRLDQGGYHEIAPQVYSTEDVAPSPHVVFDTTGGPILLDRGVRLGPFAVLQGPIYVGPGSKISPHALIKGPVSLGRTTKTGGEVGSSIVEAYSNKSHYGYLGHSYVGRWVNLGAGTANSNLKNTYGSVRVECGSKKIETGRQFLGCVIGDFSKTAINTSIFTGKLIGACSNVYGFVTTNVPSFANYARIFGEVTAFPPEVMEITQQRAFARRNIQQRPCDVAVLRHIYLLESEAGELANSPPKL